MLSFVLSIYVLQSSRDKLARYSFLPSTHLMLQSSSYLLDHLSSQALSLWPPSSVSFYVFRFVKETVADSSMPAGGVAKVEWSFLKHKVNPSTIIKVILFDDFPFLYGWEGNEVFHDLISLFLDLSLGLPSTIFCSLSPYCMLHLVLV